MFSLSAVSAAAGLTPMAIYRHFENQAVLEAVGEEGVRGLARARREHRSGRSDCMAAGAEPLIEFFFDEPARFDACLCCARASSASIRKIFEAGRSPVVSLGGNLYRGGARTPACFASATRSRLHHVDLGGAPRPGDSATLARFAMPRADFIAILSARWI